MVGISSMFHPFKTESFTVPSIFHGSSDVSPKISDVLNFRNFHSGHSLNTPVKHSAPAFVRQLEIPGLRGVQVNVTTKSYTYPDPPNMFSISAQKMLCSLDGLEIISPPEKVQVLHTKGKSKEHPGILLITRNFFGGVWAYCPLEPLKIYHLQRRVVFQASFFRGENVGFRESILEYPELFWRGLG